jgi:hypothetical protein
MADKVKLAERYGASEHGNYYVIDTMGVPHPYVIGARHVGHAADRFGGVLGDAAIRSGEMAGIHCAMKGCKLSYDQHEKAALVCCKVEGNGADGKINAELHDYLIKVKPLAEEDHYAGFAFIMEKNTK